ncbi:MAG: hypothetical protein US60_C0046G0013 [Microgenomates group bacterium GW2011_GWC1_37_8]|nr:MAG: hypothetical protein US60_C0046G0013 [Microgenomates group bacterium GW2011_GWC1_37_8]
MKYKFDYSEEKDLILREARSVGFEDVIEAINKGNILDNINHFNKKKYPNQKIFIIKIKDKVYAVPYVFDKVRQVTFLKTIYPSRTLKKKYLR